MIRMFDNNKNKCECCDNDSIVLIDFTEDITPKNVGTRLYLCDDCKSKLLDILLPF